MITRNPYDRNDLKIGKKDRVLEVGPGHSPLSLIHISEPTRPY